MSHIRSRKHAMSVALAPLSVGAASLMMLAASPAAAAEAPGAPAVAADQDSNLVTGVTITSKHKTESENLKATAPLLDTPQTRQVIGAELMQERGATTLTEALQSSPGVGTFFLGENGTTSTGDAIYMRGSDVSGSIMIDGVRDVGSVFRDVFNIEQVEVLKGGAGGEIGRSSATGAINMYTKQPNLKDLKSGSVSYGSADFKRATADVNWVVGDSTAVRINLVGQDAGVAGRDKIENKRWGVAPSVGFGLGGPTRVFVNYMHITQNNVPDGGVLTIGLPGYTTPDASRAFLSSAAKVDTSNFYGTKDDHDDVHIDTAAFILEHDIAENFSIRNLTRWTTTDQDYQLSSFMASATQLLTPNINDPSTWTIARNINNKNITNSALYNGTNIRAEFSTGPFKHTVTGGAEFIHERQKQRTYLTTGVGAYPAVSLYNPQSDVSGYTRALSGAYTVGTTNTVGVYFNDNMALTEAVFLNGGVRLDRYRTSYHSYTAANVDSPALASDTLVSGNVGLVWKPASNSSVYVSYANTKQPPGGSNFALAATNTANANNPNVEPQVAKNYEVGSKWAVFGQRLLLTGALYKTEYSDQILTDTDGTYYRAGAKSVRGVELGASGQITPAWSINTGFTTMKTKVESPTNTVPTADGTAVLTYNPDKAFTLWTTYRFEKLTIGGGARYSGDMKRGSDGAIGTPKLADGYWVVDGLAAYRIAKGVELQLNVYNLLDEDYVASINKSGYRYNPGVPRSAKLALNVSF